ncbi:hypothetical protein F2P81_010281 [Scophthalmus maximus]|uniref:Transmembrane protein 134 n=1 Tax=Scophthalmus maximus TaxID=52904 RepID=A0A6A4SVA3_SCOMX|nr:hypothetical protein F2P81_010281 [Scophthalmus maximus]
MGRSTTRRSIERTAPDERFGRNQSRPIEPRLSQSERERCTSFTQALLSPRKENKDFFKGVIRDGFLTQSVQNLENEDAFGNNGNSSFNNFFKISDPATLSYCSSQWSFSTLSSVTHLSAHCCGWVSHPLVKKNRRVVLASFLLLITGVALIFTGVVIRLNPNAGLSSAIFFVPGFLLFIPGVYHVIYICCAVHGRRGFKLFYLPYFEK